MFELNPDSIATVRPVTMSIADQGPKFRLTRPRRLAGEPAWQPRSASSKGMVDSAVTLLDPQQH
jgi:hypothetical protein